MNIQENLNTIRAVTCGGTFGGALLNFLTTGTLEEFLNAKVVEGELATMDSISFEGAISLYNAHAKLVQAQVLLAMTDHNSIPADGGSYTVGTPDNLETELQAFFSDEFAVQKVALRSPPEDLLLHDDFPCWKLKFQLDFPQKWKDLGIGTSDEHQAEPNRRSMLILVTRHEFEDSQNTALQIRGVTTLRYSTKKAMTAFKDLLEGAE